MLGGAPLNSRIGHVGRLATEVGDGQQRSADGSLAEVHALRGKQRCIGRGVKLAEQPLVRERHARRVRPKNDIQDGRVVRQARTAPQGFRHGQVVEPGKCQSVVKSLELVLELATPELADRSGPHHHEHLPGLGQQLQDVLDHERIVVDDRDSGLVVPKRGVTEILLIDGRQQRRRVGKELLSILAREDRGGAGDRDNQVRLGTIDEGRSDVVDHGLFRCAD